MNVCSPFISHSQSAELMQPRKSSLNYPSLRAQPTAMATKAFGGQRFDSHGAQLFSMRLRIISTISKHLVWSTARTTSLASDRRYGLDQSHQLSHIMSVGSSQDRRQRNPISVSNHMMFAAWLGSVRGVGTCFSPRLQPLGWRRYRRRHETSQFHLPLVTWPAEPREGSARLQRCAIPSDDASTSCLNRSPSPEATSPKGCRSLEQTQSLSAPLGPRLVCDQDNETSSAWLVAEVDESV